MTTSQRSILGVVAALGLGLTSCAALTSVGDKVTGFIPDPSQPSLLPLDETQILYARAVRSAMKNNGFEALGLSPSEKVWVVSKNLGTNPDTSLDAITYDGIVYALRQKGVAEVVERDDDLQRALYVEHTESAKLDAKDKALAQQGKLLNADVVLAYRVIRINYRSPGLIILGVRGCVGGIMGLFNDAQVQITNGIRVAINFDVIDTKTGLVRTSKIVEVVEPQPSWFATDEVYAGVRESAPVAAGAAAGK